MVQPSVIIKLIRVAVYMGCFALVCLGGWWCVGWLVGHREDVVYDDHAVLYAAS